MFLHYSHEQNKLVYLKHLERWQGWDLQFCPQVQKSGNTLGDSPKGYGTFENFALSPIFKSDLCIWELKSLMEF